MRCASCHHTSRHRSDFRVRAHGRPTHQQPQRQRLIAIVVPYREQPEQDRKSQLLAFLTHMRSFLRGARFLIVVAEQSQDGRKFNRGQLLNAGYQEARRQAAPMGLASVILHDCDLLPSAELLPWYASPPSRGSPCHISAASAWSKYADAYADSDAFFGGVTAFHPLDFEAANGYPNDYWGWGLEDDQLRLRAEACGALSRGIVRPPPGVGRFVDQDCVNVLRVLHSPALRDAHPQLYNSRFHSLRGTALALDPGWQGEDGLRGLACEVESRGSAETLSAALSLLRLRLRLAQNA